MKKIGRIALRTLLITCFVISIIYIVKANERLCAAIKLHNECKNIQSDMDQQSKILIKLKSDMVIQPHTVVLMSLGENEQWKIEDIKKFEKGQHKEFLEYIKR